MNISLSSVVSLKRETLISGQDQRSLYKRASECVFPEISIHEIINFHNFPSTVKFPELWTKSKRKLKNDND